MNNINNAIINNFLSSNLKTPIEEYESQLTENSIQDYHNFIEKICQIYPHYRDFYNNKPRITKSQELGMNYTTYIYDMTNMESKIKMELARQGIFKPKDFVTIKTPLALITGQDVKVTPEIVEFLTNEYNRTKSFLYLKYRYDLKKKFLCKVFNRSDLYIKTRIDKDYFYLLKNLKERGFENANGILEVALDIMPNKIKNFTKLNNAYFELIDEGINNSTYLKELYINGKSKHDINQHNVYNVLEKYTKEKWGIAKQINQLEMDAYLNRVSLSPYKASSKNTRIKER